MAASSTVVRFEDVNLSFGSTVALDHVSFEMQRGDTRVVFGAAGSGKTTLLKVALGLLRPDSGKVFLFDEEITHLKEQELFEIRARVGILFQEGGLFDSMTIGDNVAYPLLNQQAFKLTHQNGPLQNGGARSVDERVREALHFVELDQTFDKVPSELSGGMRRRAGIARAVVTEPELLLYDSPTAGLDPITANTIIAVILKDREVRNTATIMVTHRFLDGHLVANFRYNPSSGKMERARAAAEGNGRAKTQFFVMNQGRLVFVGTEAELEASTDDYVRKFLRHGSS
jgi:phospholipid/cholesterol/gamma-HCH transport system ATP-binding protein